MTGYAGKVEQWRWEEREVAESGQLNPLMDIDERSRHFLKARQPSKLKEGRTKYNDLKIEEVEKRIFEVTAAQKSGSFEPRRDRDVLSEALGNPEHRSRVCGISSKKCWKDVESWQAEGSSYRSRQRYKKELIQKDKDDAVKEMIMGKIQDAFMSTEPKMVQLRMQMFEQAGVLLLPG